MDVDYPRTQTEFEEQFSTEQACHDYLSRLRWPDGFQCPHCPGRKAWEDAQDRLICSTCGYQASVTRGTIFHGTRKPLRLWFQAAWWLTAQKHGSSALGLQRLLGLGQYKTAWAWLHKLRRAMVRPGRDRLSGRVEVDETYVGGPASGARGRQLGAKQALVLVAEEEAGAGIGRIRLRRVADASAPSLEAFVREAVEPGSVVRTDGWTGYARLSSLGYPHEVVVTGGDEQRVSKHFPRVHRVASLLKRWLLGTHQGAVRPSYLDYYLDEFTFRFNRRTSRSRGKLFRRLLEQAVAVDPAPLPQMQAAARAKASRMGPDQLA